MTEGKIFTLYPSPQTVKLVGLDSRENPTKHVQRAMRHPAIISTLWDPFIDSTSHSVHNNYFCLNLHFVILNRHHCWEMIKTWTYFINGCTCGLTDVWFQCRPDVHDYHFKRATIGNLYTIHFTVANLPFFLHLYEILLCILNKDFGVLFLSIYILNEMRYSYKQCFLRKIVFKYYAKPRTAIIQGGYHNKV